MTCLRQVARIIWPVSSLLMSTVTGAPRARARSEGAQDSTNRTAATTTPTAAVARAAAVRNFRRLSAISMSLAIEPLSLIPYPPSSRRVVTNTDRDQGRCLNRRGVSHYTRPFGLFGGAWGTQETKGP